MSATITVGLYFNGWTRLAFASEFDGFTAIRITAEKNGGIVNLDVSPPTFKNVSFFAIESTNYANLHILIDGVKEFEVTGPFALFTKSQVGLLSPTISTVTVTNYDTVSDADVSIYVGRDVALGPLYGLYFYKDFNSMYVGAL